jgi:hypothetical protein
MSYWIRAVDPLQLGALGLLSLSWAVGGWLIVTHAFAVKTRERLLTGIAAGFVLFLTLSNLLARLLPLPGAFSVAAGLILLAGILLGWRARGRRAFVNPGDLQAWPQLLFLSGITAVFTVILRGLAIFDDYLHLPLVSIMGAGDIPPHFYLNPAVTFSYHYALQVFAACLERLGSFYPWSSWDVSRGIAFAFTLVLGWLWFRRVTGSSFGAVLGSLLLGFGGGARWTLLFLPTSWLARMGAGLQIQASAIASGGSLTKDLISPFATQGAGPFPFPFAYTNAIYDPLNFVLGGTGALPALTVVLLLLMARPRFSRVGVAVYSLILANLALSGENVYAVLLGGVIVAAALTLLTRGRAERDSLRSDIMSWAAVMGISLVLSLVQGAFLTDVAVSVAAAVTGSTAASTNVHGFALRWPPALLSGHFGPLSLLSPGQVVILLAELGPVVALGPVVSLYAIRQRRSSHWLWQGLTYGALVSFVVPIFVRYGVDRSITRLPATAVWLWSLLGFVLLWRWLPRARAWARWASGFGYAIAVFGGFVLFAIQLMAIQTPTLSYFIRSLDGQVARMYWNRLEPNAQILDAIPERAVTIFGRASRAYSDIYTPLPDWQALVGDPDPSVVHRAGYAYIYLDRQWWNGLTSEQQHALDRPCVRLIDHRTDADGDFRTLVDVRGCN